MSLVPKLVSGDWLQQNLIDNKSEHFVVLHASWNGGKCYESGHIPGAILFDGKKCATDSGLPNTLPSPKQFQTYIRSLGITNDDHIICYSANPRDPFGTRLWYTLGVFGHDRRSVLDGGLQKWISDGRPVTIDVTPTKLLATFDEVLNNLSQPVAQFVDSREAEQYTGTWPKVIDDSTRKDKFGRVRGSLWVPTSRLLKEDGTFKDHDQLTSLMKQQGVQLDEAMISSCATGMRATMLAFAADLVGLRDIKLYDGSWSEFKQRAPAYAMILTPEPVNEE